MLHRCPHCGEYGVTEMATRWSSRRDPAQCGRCPNYAHVLASTASGIFAGTLLVFVGALVLAAGLQSGLAVVPGVCVAIAFNLWAWRRVELIPITKESAVTARKVNWWVAALSALLAPLGR